MNNNKKTSSLTQKGNRASGATLELQKKSRNPFRRRTSLDAKKSLSGWIFVSPFVIGLLLIYIPVVWDSIKYSFCEIQSNYQTGSYSLDFVGFDNYSTALFKDAKFVKTLLEGLQQMIFDIPAIIIFSLFIAVVLNQKMFGRAAFRAIFFIPVILSTGIMETVASKGSAFIENSETEIDDGSGNSVSDSVVSAVDIEALLSGMKVGTQLVTYVAQAVSGIYDIVNRSGVQMLIFLAGLQSISPSIYEACKIDGATSWETFWKITFPMISPMILVNSIYTIIDSFTTQDNVVMSYISNAYSTIGREVSTAMSWMYFGIVLLVIVVFVLIASAFVFYQKRD